MATNKPEYASVESILAAHRVTADQVSKCEKIEQTSPIHQIFYVVASASQAGVEYKVSYNAERGGLQCQSWNDGPVCLASASGSGCWHRRAAVAAWQIEKLEAYQARVNEQARVEATEEYKQEQAERAALDDVIAEAEAALACAESDVHEARSFSREADSREARAVARDGARAYQPGEIHRDEQGRILR